MKNSLEGHSLHREDLLSGGSSLLNDDDDDDAAEDSSTAVSLPSGVRITRSRLDSCGLVSAMGHQLGMETL